MNRFRHRALAVAAILITLTALTLAVTSGVLAAADQALLAWFAAWRNPAADVFFRWATCLGSFYVLGPGVAVGVLLLRYAGRTGDALRFGIAFYGAALTTLVFKSLLGRERPGLFEPLLQTLPVDAAFPSGHATHAAALTFCLLWLARRDSRYWKLALSLLLPYVGLVAASRLYLQVHWPSDVLAGILLAWLWVAGASWLAPLPGSHRKDNA